MFKVPTAVQVRVTLQEIEPDIWRRVIVPSTFDLGALHQVIQAAFGWWDYHLHEFLIGGLSFSDPDLVQPEFEGDPRVYDERPPEDVGGPYGYAEFLSSLADRRHPEHAEYKRWVGGHFDPEWFDLNLCDRDVRRALSPNRPIRLKQPTPRRTRAQTRTLERVDPEVISDAHSKE